MSDQADGAIKNLGIFSTLQAATDQKQFLLCASFALLIDNVLAFFHQPTLMDIARDKSMLVESNITVQVILIFVAYSFLVSLVLPLAAMIYDQIYILTVGSWVSSIDRYLDRKLGREPKTVFKKPDYVRPWELREEAHQSMEKYYLDLYKSYEQEWRADRENMIRFALYSFSCLVMLGVNFLLGDDGRHTAAFVVANYFESNAPIWCSLAGLAVMNVWRFYAPSDPDWIYCPNLYKKIHGPDEPRYAVIKQRIKEKSPESCE